MYVYIHTHIHTYTQIDFPQTSAEEEYVTEQIELVTIKGALDV